jgi:hypothetical protein
MSFDDTQMQPVADAPGLSAGTSGLDPNQKLQVRQVKGATLAGFTPGEGDVVSTTPVPTTETTSARAREIAGPTSFGYVGQNLVDSRGIITRGQYDPSKEAYAELAKMDLVERQTFLNSLAARGLYGSGKPSPTGFDSKDFSAMGDFLRFANSQGVTSDVAYSQFLTTFKGGGRGRAVRTTPKQDIRSIFKTVSGVTLGRQLPPDVIERFVKAFEGLEITEATGGPKAPSIANAAEAQIEQQYGAEAASVGMLSLFDILDKSIKGLA